MDTEMEMDLVGIAEWYLLRNCNAGNILIFIEQIEH